MNGVEASVWNSLEPTVSLPDSKPSGRCGHGEKEGVHYGVLRVGNVYLC